MGNLTTNDYKGRKRAQKGQTNEETLVLIPYLPSGAQGRELELAITGWRRHYRHPFHIVVVGEGLEAAKAVMPEADDLTYVESERVPAKEGSYRQHLDYVSCFRKVRELFPDKVGFVQVADDCFAVSDFTLEDIVSLKVDALEFDGDPDSENGFSREKRKTRLLLDREGLPHRYFTTHCPYYFEWAKWEKVVRKYGMDSDSYIIENVYYNTFNGKDDAILLNHDSDDIRCWMSRANIPLSDALKAMNKKKWICAAVNAYGWMLEDILAEHYGLK